MAAFHRDHLSTYAIHHQLGLLDYQAVASGESPWPPATMAQLSATDVEGPAKAATPRAFGDSAGAALFLSTNPGIGGPGFVHDGCQI
jgi:hypothetical protein